MAIRSISSGSISFGLVSIPVKLYTATSAASVSFSQLHTCGSRTKQQLLCAAEGKVIERAELVRGVEVAPDQWVTFTDEELKALESSRPAVLELAEFVPVASVDPLFVEKSSYLGPDEGGARAYALLARALGVSGRVGVGTFTKRGKDALAVVRPLNGGLVLHECYYATEVRPFGEIDLEAPPLSSRELELAAQLVDRLAQPMFVPERYADSWAARVQAAVDEKRSSGAVVVTPSVAPAPTSDLVEALERTLRVKGPGPRKAKASAAAKHASR